MSRWQRASASAGDALRQLRQYAAVLDTEREVSPSNIPIVDPSASSPHRNGPPERSGSSREDYTNEERDNQFIQEHEFTESSIDQSNLNHRNSKEMHSHDTTETEGFWIGSDSVQENQTLPIDHAPQDPPATEEPCDQYIRILDTTGKFYRIQCELNSSVLDLKSKVFELAEVPINSQRLIFRGRLLVDEQVLEQCEVEHGHTIHLFVRRHHSPSDSDAFTSTEDGVDSGDRSNNTTGGVFYDEGHMGMMHLSSHGVSSAVYPSDSIRGIDPLMLDSPLGNAARRVKLWSSFLLIIYTMKVMGQFALLANDQQARNRQVNHPLDERDAEIAHQQLYQYGVYFKQSPITRGIELIVHAFGVYVGCIGFKAAHGTDVRPIRFFCRGVVWLAVLTVLEQVYITIQISKSNLYPQERIEIGYGQTSALDDVVSANIFQAVMLLVMWVIVIHHAYAHQGEISRYNQSFANAAMNTIPVAHIPTEVVV
uniref:Ubiquitin family protein putative n=1 Tax=Albugo laibachii Nc14 TaxID=890382 RepID=F0WNK8_9STRA|nr:ubiquitin family protein putative [Albugo laibachii Nc14]|eukprot:CCA22899.1 ubiquitin family protein putative [Albugo laibachii Nc14]